MRINILSGLVLFSLSLLIFSCAEQPAGLLFSVEQERLIDDKNLSNDMTAGSMVVFDMDADTTDDFVLAAGKIYHSTASADRSLQGNWSSSLHLGDQYMSYHVFALGGNLYGLFYDKNASLADSGSKLYRWDTGSLVWVPVVADSIDQLRLEDGAAAGSYLYLSSYILESDGSRTYSLIAFDGTNVSPITAAVGSAAPRLDAAADGSDVFLVYGDLLLGGTEPALSVVADAHASLAQLGNDKLYRGLHYSTLRNAFLLSADDGSVWFYDTDLVWKPYNEIGMEAFDFQDFTHTAAGVSVVTLGSAEGYFEMETGSTDFIKPEVSTSLNNYLTLGLSQGAVRSLFTFSDGLGTGDDILFALTNGSGLWSLREDGDGLVWNQE